MCRALASTVMVLAPRPFSNEIADAVAKAAANGIARPEAVAHRCRESDPLERRPFPDRAVQVVNLEAALFWQEVSRQRTNAAPRTETRVRPKAVCRARLAALSPVSANVLTLHPADVQPDTMIGCNFTGRALDLNAAMHELGADIVGKQEALDALVRRGRDSILRSLRRPRRKDMVVSNSGYTITGFSCEQDAGGRFERSSHACRHPMPVTPPRHFGRTRAC